MGKAKMFGGASVLVGLILGIISYFMAKPFLEKVGIGFMTFVLSVYLPVLLITVGLIAIVIGVLLLIYG